MPVRIQRLRKKGWKAPAGTINCTRPSHYGNPFKIGHWYMKGDAGGRRDAFAMIYTEALGGSQDERFTQIKTAEEAVEWYRWYIEVTNAKPRIRRDLAGANLMCFCPLSSACHVDLLLEIANSE